MEFGQFISWELDPPVSYLTYLIHRAHPMLSEFSNWGGGRLVLSPETPDYTYAFINNIRTES